MSPEHEGKNTGLEKLRLGKSTLRKVLVSAIIGTSSSLSEHQFVIISQVDNIGDLKMSLAKFELISFMGSNFIKAKYPHVIPCLTYRQRSLSGIWLYS